MNKFKVDDEVVVLAGKDKGKTGKVQKLNWKQRSAIVAGVNRIRKAVRPTQENPAGGFLDLEKPIHMSNIAVVSPKTNGPTRVRIEEKDGKKVRVATKCGSVLS